jgi:hypothetical protein
VLGQQQQQQLKLRRIRPGKIVCHFIEFLFRKSELLYLHDCGVVMLFFTAAECN